MSKAEKKKRKKNKKLLPQVGLIVFTIFFVIMIVTGWLVYTGSRQIYLQAKNELIDRDLLRIRDNLSKISGFVWMLDYCEAHTEVMKRDLQKDEPMTDKDTDLITEFMSAFYQKYKKNFEEEKIDDAIAYEELNKAPADMQFAMAKRIYQNTLLDFYIAAYQTNYDRMYALDIKGDNYGFVYHEIDVDQPDEFFFGDTWDYPIEEHPAIQTLLTGKQGEDYENTVYELARIDSKEKYYIGCTPLFAFGEVRCAICISFDWSAFRDAMLPYIIAMFIIGFIIMILSAVILLHFLRVSAIRPLQKIQEGVRRYMDDKDSDAVAAAMETIRSKNEFGTLRDDVNALAKEIDRYNEENVKLATEKERVSAELGLAAKIQSDMLPKVFPDHQQFELYASMDPAKEVGGDFYDFFKIDDTHLGLVIADVSGKGIPASLYMMMSMIVIRNYARAGKSPSEVLRKSNRSICENNDDTMFVTVWFGIMDITSGHVIASNAGHEYPMLKKADGSFELFKDKHGFVIGGMPDMKYKDYEFDIEKGGTLFLYTDGAPEATDVNEQLFGTKRMLDALNKAPDDHPKALIDRMTEAINDFVGEAPQFDDLTMLCVKYSGDDDTEKQ